MSLCFEIAGLKCYVCGYNKICTVGRSTSHDKKQKYNCQYLFIAEKGYSSIFF